MQVFYIVLAIVALAFVLFGSYGLIILFAKHGKALTDFIKSRFASLFR